MGVKWVGGVTQPLLFALRVRFGKCLREKKAEEQRLACQLCSLYVAASSGGRSGGLGGGGSAAFTPHNNQLVSAGR